MDVKEFVAETLKQVTEAVNENESTLRTGNCGIEKLDKLNIILFGDSFITYVDFDIAVTESTTKEGGAKLSIAGIGGCGGDLTNGTETVSRVKFRVPIQVKQK
jgi:mevalonate kinase